MKTLILIASCACAMAAPPMTARFDNGDSINGSMVGISKNTITWNSDFLVDPQQMTMESLVDVALPDDGGSELPEGDHIAVLTLTNKDVIRGSLLSLDEKEIGLRTSFAGDLVFRRDMVAALDIQDMPKLHYSGPKSLDEWVIQDEDDWKYELGTLVSNGTASIARDMGKHDIFRLSFDIEWRGNPRFRVLTCADNIDSDDVGNCFELVCQNRNAYLRKRTNLNGRSEAPTIGNSSNVSEFQEREKVRIELLQDLISGRIRFMVAGRVVADWKDLAPGPGNFGGVVHFVNDSGKDIRISRIRVSSWDGTVKGDWQDGGNVRGNFQLGVVEEKKEEEDEPLSGIQLRNGDIVEGETLGIEDGKVKLNSPLGEFVLPVSRLRSFSLRSAEEAADPELTWKPIIRNGDIRAHFSEGGQITFELTGLEDETIRGKSQTFGEAEFDLSAFRRLEFNLYSADYGSDW